MPEDKRGCSGKGVDLFCNNVLIISRLLKVDCDMGQTRRNVTWVKSKQKYHLLKLNSIEGHKPFSFLSFNQRSSERPTLSTRWMIMEEWFIILQNIFNLMKYFFTRPLQQTNLLLIIYLYDSQNLWWFGKNKNEFMLL